MFYTIYIERLLQLAWLPLASAWPPSVNKFWLRPCVEMISGQPINHMDNIFQCGTNVSQYKIIINGMPYKL